MGRQSRTVPFTALIPAGDYSAGVRMRVRFPSFWRNVKDLHFERGIDTSRGDAALVEQVWPYVSCGHPPLEMKSRRIAVSVELMGEGAPPAGLSNSGGAYGT